MMTSHLTAIRYVLWTLAAATNYRVEGWQLVDLLGVDRPSVIGTM